LNFRAQKFFLSKPKKSRQNPAEQNKTDLPPQSLYIIIVMGNIHDILLLVKDYFSFLKMFKSLLHNENL